MNNFPENIENIRLALRYFMCLFSIWKRIGIGGLVCGWNTDFRKSRRARVLNRGIMTDEKFLCLLFGLMWLFDNVLQINNGVCHRSFFYTPSEIHVSFH